MENILRVIVLFTHHIRFDFECIAYRQIDNVAIGIPLGQRLSDVFYPRSGFIQAICWWYSYFYWPYKLCQYFELLQFHSPQYFSFLWSLIDIWYKRHLQHHLAFSSNAHLQHLHNKMGTIRYHLVEAFVSVVPWELLHNSFEESVRPSLCDGFTLHELSCSRHYQPIQEQASVHTEHGLIEVFGPGSACLTNGLPWCCCRCIYQLIGVTDAS